MPASEPKKCLHKPRVIITTCQLNKAKGMSTCSGLWRFFAKMGGFSLYCCRNRSYEEVKLSAEELGISDLVEFTGYVPSVAEQLARADIYVLPSYCEALGIALEEAMASGLVCVARKNGGVPEIWPPSELDLLVDKDDRGEAFAAALGGLLELADDELLEKGQIFYRHASQAFHAEKQAKSWKTYQKAAALNPAFDRKVAWKL